MSEAHFGRAEARGPSVPAYIPAAPFAATRLDGTSVLIPRRRRIQAWRPSTTSASYAPALSEPLDVLMPRVRARPSEVAREPRRRWAADSRMWVDKYRPRAFTDLLGDDRLHRDVLRWVKAWDPCVFGCDAPRARRVDERVPDKFGRPHERVLLLSGPPGLGKTTLAHVVAQHAGYRVYELNASDARTAADVESRVRTALESDSLRGHGRPTLVVIDEIDGATGGSDALGTSGFVRALVRLLERGAGAPRGKKSQPILRPIVCICNDLYAPALRPLRPMSQIVRCYRPPTPLITRRLREICAREHLSADTRGLTMLCDVSHGDLRACLHALELLHRDGRPVSVSTIQDASVGIKDSVVPLQRLWTQLFCAMDPTHVSWHGSHIHALVHELTAFGDYDRLTHGCFEHYIHLRVPDQGWQRYADALDWLHFSQRMMHGTSFELLPYVPWTWVAWHHLFANIANPVPEQPPRHDYERHMQLRATLETTEALRRCLPAHLAPFYAQDTIACELGPALARILSPDIKVHATPYASALPDLVDTMLLYGMSFEADRNEHGALVHRLHPCIDVFAQYAAHSQADVGPSRHGARQHVQRELEAEQRRRRRRTLPETATQKEAPSSPLAASATAPTYRDFFGRVMPAPAVPSQADAAPAGPSGLQVFYRFHEGYSNAVRKPIKLASLL